MASFSSSSRIRRYHVFPSFHGADVRRGFLSHLHNYFARKGITTFRDHEMERGHTIGPELVQAIRESRISIKEWLQDQRVLIILDDVDDLEKLEALARELSWFGFGSRIIVTTEDKKILKAHEIDVIYDVGFPSREEALEILCLSAFKQSIVRDGFEELADRVAALCGNLPLGLSVVGSSLRGESKNEWELQISRIESSLDRKIEDVLRVGYERLSKKDQTLFLHIACIFSVHYFKDDVTTLLADSNLDVENGIKNLVVKSLVQNVPWIEMHSLLKQMGKQVVHEQSDDPGKRQFLVEVEEIRDVLANETGTGSVIGISLDMSNIGEFSISGRAFEKMCNLRFLRFYTTRYAALLMHILGDMTYLPRVRLLHWDLYPRKRLPPTFQPECLVELCMKSSQLEKLWGGVQPLANLKKINLAYSTKLKEIPNLSKATNLETLRLRDCTSLVELPSSIRNLHKLDWLEMSGCENLRVIPTNINLASLRRLDMGDCSRLKTFPDFSSNVYDLQLYNTKIKDVPASVAGSWLCLHTLSIGRRSLKRLTNVPESVRFLDLSYTDIKRIPDCVTGLPRLRILSVHHCKKLVSLQSLPPSLLILDATGCGSLQSVCFSFEPRAYITLDDCKCLISEKDAIRVSSRLYHPNRQVDLIDCPKLDEEARRVIIQRWAYKCVCLPGKEIPAEFTHKAKENSITISPGAFSASSRFKACLLLSPTEQVSSSSYVVCHVRSNGVLINELHHNSLTWSGQLLTEHLLVFSGALFEEHRCLEVDMTTREILFEFSCLYFSEIIDGKIIECGVQILAEEGEMDISSSFDDPNRSVTLTFPNCLSLDEEARIMIIQRWAYRYVFLPGKEVPAEFTHKAKGNSITISPGTFSASSRFKACLLLSTAKQFEIEMVCRLRSKGVLINELKIQDWQGVGDYLQLLTEHLFVFRGLLFKEQRSVEVDATTNEIQFEFSWGENNGEIIECGVEMLAKEGESSSRQWKEQSDGAVEVSRDESVVKSSNHTGWWSWLGKLGLKKKKKMMINKTE